VNFGMPKVVITRIELDLKGLLGSINSRNGLIQPLLN